MPTLGAVSLPVDPVWVDEFGEWSPIEQSEEYSLTGALLIQQSVKQAGRPITLDLSRLLRSELLAIVALADVAGAQHTLTIAQGTYTVMFRRPPYDVKPIRGVSDPDDVEPYSVTLNLMTV